MQLAPLSAILLQAMTRPDPRPPMDLDNPVAAIARRVPGTPIEEVIGAVRAMNNLGLTQVPSVLGAVSGRVTENPKDWITQEGWKALGMDSSGSTN
ncbi:MAG: hypothetical protein LAO05_13970 [Acidobacteriia bacterium]|nr:hypothetical protein [Terriglobia bacterium]